MKGTTPWHGRQPPRARGATALLRPACMCRAGRMPCIRRRGVSTLRRRRSGEGAAPGTRAGEALPLPQGRCGSRGHVGAEALSMPRALRGREQYARRCRRVGGEPAVRERLLRAEPVLGLELQQTAHEALRGSRGRSEWTGREGGGRWAVRPESRQVGRPVSIRAGWGWGGRRGVGRVDTCAAVEQL